MDVINTNKLDVDKIVNIKNKQNKVLYSDIIKKDKENYTDNYNYSDSLTSNIKKVLNITKNNDGNMKIPNIKLTINGINYDGDKLIIESIKNKTNSLSKNDEKISILINDMENYFADFNNKMKQIIGDKINNDYFKIILFNNLNKIGSEIELFKNNYKDIVKYN